MFWVNYHFKNEILVLNSVAAGVMCLARRVKMGTYVRHMSCQNRCLLHTRQVSS